jgi:hypothetical protein
MITRRASSLRLSPPEVLAMASKTFTDAAVAKLDEVKSRNAYTGHCSYYVATAVNAGLPNGARRLYTQGKLGPANGGSMGPKLEEVGFGPVSSVGYVPQAGDVAVVPGPTDDKRQPPPGHVAMYDGKEWVSDTRQGGSANPYNKKRTLSGEITYYRYKF